MLLRVLKVQRRSLSCADHFAWSSSWTWHLHIVAGVAAGTATAAGRDA
jgi:hypothetical protein